jgi:DNA-binding GntR family transcriptional regulator
MRLPRPDQNVQSTGDALVTRTTAPNSRPRGSANTPVAIPSVYDAIREGILTGRYAPGERLVETRLAAELGVSRTGIRDALARLEANYLLSPAPNRGMVVRHLTPRDIEEIYALRLLLEGHAANAAATNITTGEIEQLRALNARMGELEAAGAGSIEQERLTMICAVANVNNEFHRLIQRAARNGRLERMLQTVVDRPLVFQSFYWYSDNELSEACAEHVAILKALELGDNQGADSLMRRHITRGLNTLLREMPQV